MLHVKVLFDTYDESVSVLHSAKPAFMAILDTSTTPLAGDIVSELIEEASNRLDSIGTVCNISRSAAVHDF